MAPIVAESRRTTPWYVAVTYELGGLEVAELGARVDNRSRERGSHWQVPSGGERVSDKRLEFLCR
jgi:hypothetical protein